MNKDNLIWIDLEMTGLNPDIHKIIEIATLITDKNLNILSEGPEISIYQPINEINLMNKWNFSIHSSNGLIEKVKKSNINENQAEIKTLKFLKKWVPKGVSPICGNTVAQDRRFLFKYMPNLEKYFHYRYLDVSSIKELVYRWSPKILLNLNKKIFHKALEDIKESVYELNFYKKNFFKK